MAHVLVVGHVAEPGLAILREAGHAVQTIVEGDEAGLAAALPDAEAILLRTMRLTPELVDLAPALRIVSRHGVGYDNVPVEHLTRRRIPLAIAATANKIAVAEAAFAMMLEIAKRSRAHDAATRSGNWTYRSKNEPIELYAKTLLLVGYGRIGAELATRAAAFGMRVVVHDPYAAAVPYERADDLDAALPEADVVSLHLPRTPETLNLIGRERLARLKPSAILVNTARGGLVDEAALAEALREGRLRGAGIDVFDNEPVEPGNPLLGLGNVLLSPHSGGITQESALRMATEAATNIVAALAGRLDPGVCVNREVLG